MKKVNNKKGFTLAELLVVIAVLAILIAIAVPTFTGALSQARKTADDANIRSAYAAYTIEQMSSDPTHPDAQAAGPDVTAAFTAIGVTELQYYNTITVPKTGAWTGTAGTNGSAIGDLTINIAS